MRICNVNYTDLDNKKQSGTFFFNMNKFQVAKFVMTCPEEAKTVSELTQKGKTDATFEDLEKALAAIMKASYGTMDANRKFVGDIKAGEDFVNTEAYYELAGGLLLNPEELIEFMKAVAPGVDLSEAQAEISKLKD